MWGMYMYMYMHACTQYQVFPPEQEQLSLARRKREEGIYDLQSSARDLPDDDGRTSPDSFTLPQPSQPVPTSKPMSVAATQDHMTTLPPLSLHQASCSSLEFLPLLSSSAPPQPTTVPLPSHHHDDRPTPPTTSLQLSHSLRLSHASTLQHSNLGNTGRRYSPASSPTHSFRPPLTMGMLGSGRSFKRELAHIEQARNMRQLALLAEQVRLL